MQIDFTLSKEQGDLKQRAHAYALEFRPFVADYDAANRAPIAETVEAARRHNLLGITMPKEYGGLNMTATDYLVAHEEVIRTGTLQALSEALFGTSGPGASLCLRSDNEVLRQKFLAGIVSGKKMCAITMTEPMYGSNLDDLQTTAEEKSDHFVINGSKRFITGALDDELYATFVRFNNIPGSRGIGSIMIEAGTPGVTILEGPAFVGARGVPHGELYFENAKVPKENLMFREGNFGRMMEPFNMERLHNACGAVGWAEAALDEALKYTQTRKAFGKFICEFQAVYQDLAEMATQIQAARCLVYRAASTAVDGRYPQLMDVTMAKLFASQVVTMVAQKAMILHGGDGTTMNFPIQRIWRGSQIYPVAGGSPAILRNMIAGRMLNRKFDQHK
ncbi:MAG: acyl-CoA dehydrogenase family protein [Dehalococcoidia bacterium]|nr:acyl-CoA dehydrogenase family protein [Dehalococcoidia bacterium]